MFLCVISISVITLDSDADTNGYCDIVLLVTFVLYAKAGGRNEMIFDRDTRVAPNNTVLDKGPVPREKLNGLT